jgi:hypothetical protein
MADLWNIGFCICSVLWFRCGIQGVAVLLHPGSNPFQSCASFPLLFFYLILQRIRPLIYSADIANRPKLPARNVDSAIVLRTGVKFENAFSILQDVSGHNHAHACVDSLSNRICRYLTLRSATEELSLHGYLHHKNAVSDVKEYFGKLFFTIFFFPKPKRYYNCGTTVVSAQAVSGKNC